MLNKMRQFLLPAEPAFPAISDLVEYIIANPVYRRKWLNAIKAKYVIGYRQYSLFLLYLRYDEFWYQSNTGM
jgi:hypothetical protein